MNNNKIGLLEKYKGTKPFHTFFSVYSFLIAILSIPFERLEKSSLVKSIGAFFKNNPKKDYLILICIVLGISCVLFNKFIFGNYVFVYNERDVSQDCIAGLYPYIYHIYNNKEGFSWWSFNSGLGNNMFPTLLTYCFTDPFTFIGAIFWNPIENGFIYTHILKLLCISLVFYKFILLVTQNRYSALVTSILMAFCGFLMLNGQHYYFVNKVLYFILLIYAIEIFLVKNNKTLLFFVLLLNLFDVYFFYQNVFFVFVYLIFRSVYHNYSFKFHFNKVVQISIIGFIALLVSSFLLLPYVHVLASGPRVSTNKIELSKMIFSLNPKEFYFNLIGRFFSNNLSGNGLNYFSEFMIIPQIFSGLITILVLPQMFKIPNKNHRYAFILLFIFSFTSLILPFFAYLFTAFQELYFRWTYGIVFFNLLIFAYLIKSTLVNHFLNKKILIITYISLITILLLFWIYFRRNEGEWIWINNVKGLYLTHNSNLKYVVLRILIYLSIYTFLLTLIKKYKLTICLFLIFLVSSEIVLENYSFFYNRRIVVKNNNRYENTSKEAINYIKSIDQSKFYRIEKNYLSIGNGFEFNDALVHDYYGLKTYNSYNNKEYLQFCKVLNLVPQKHWANLLPSWRFDLYNRYKLLNLFSVKYLLSKKEIKDSNLKFYSKRKDIYIYKNLKTLPFGFTYSKVIARNTFNKLNNDQKDSIVNSDLVLEKNTFLKYSKRFNKQYKRNYFKIIKFSNSNIIGSIDSKVSSLLFFSIPYDKGWEIFINGKKTNYIKANIGFIVVPINKGQHKVELKYTPPLFKEGLWISLSTILGILIFFIIKKMRKKNKIAIYK